MYPNLQDRPEGEYLTDAITVKAEELIAQAVKDDVPFFMNMAQFAVHTQIAAAPDFELARDYFNNLKIFFKYFRFIFSLFQL